MLDSNGFDEWSKQYDKSVQNSEKAGAYPFAGYDEVLEKISFAVKKKKNPEILDLGFGTAVLTKELYDFGCSVYGIDFSLKMTECARNKMPKAYLFNADFKNGLPDELRNKKFDFIISTYAFHHLNDNEKILFADTLLEHLKDGGSLFIGDVAFQTAAEMENCKEKYEKEWDYEENYTVFDDFQKKISKDGFSFEKVSHCAGIISYKKTKKPRN